MDEDIPPPFDLPAVDALDILSHLRDHGVAEHMIDLGGDVSTNGVSKLVFTILSAVAEAERDRSRERVTEVKRDQRQRGRYLGGIGQRPPRSVFVAIWSPCAGGWEDGGSG
jgi:DNA invertase Pin-like site-specific DNA recombinase